MHACWLRGWSSVLCFGPHPHAETGNNMKCTPQSCGNIRPIIHDDITASITCAIHGTTYLYRHDGKWETAKDRQERMKNDLLCDDCGDEFRAVLTSNAGGNALHVICPKCCARRRNESHARAAAKKQANRPKATKLYPVERVATPW